VWYQTYRSASAYGGGSGWDEEVSLVTRRRELIVVLEISMQDIVELARLWSTVYLPYFQFLHCCPNGYFKVLVKGCTSFEVISMNSVRFGCLSMLRPHGRPDKSGPMALNQFRPSVPVWSETL